MAQREKEGTLKFETTYESDEAAKRGKNPIIAKDIETDDVPTSEIIEEWETVNDKAVTEAKPDISISFAIEPDYDLLGKVVGDLQEDMAVAAGTIMGTSHYVTDYTGFSGDPDEQEGNYMAFMANYSGTYTKITAQGGSAPEVIIDPADHTHVMIIKAIKPLVIRAYDGDKVVCKKTYNIAQLTLETAENV